MTNLEMYLSQIFCTILLTNLSVCWANIFFWVSLMWLQKICNTVKSFQFGKFCCRTLQIHIANHEEMSQGELGAQAQEPSGHTSNQDPLTSFMLHIYYTYFVQCKQILTYLPLLNRSHLKRWIAKEHFKVDTFLTIYI